MKYFTKQLGYFLFLNLLFFTGCTHIPTFQERKSTALDLAHDKDIVQINIKTSSFELFSMQKLKECKNKDMKVYIEGDGLAWVTRRKISDDPTPLKPLGLSLMLSDSSSCKVYVARPCQYIKQSLCHKKYWTSYRFNTEVIDSYNEALDTLKERHKNSSFTLVGYSGGGAVATLSAASRNDVSTLITVAGNLDTAKWIELHRITPLDGSLNPADFSNTLEHIPQYHLIGKNDTVIPKDIYDSYLSKFNKKENIKYF